MTSHISISKPINRLIFLDKIRYTMVLGVVVLHAACAYSNIIPWWSVLDSDRKPFFDLFILILDIYQMPILFFVAGYFAFPSLKRYGTGKFVVSKLKRLGLPLIVAGLFYVPIITFIGHFRNTEAPVGFFRDWLNQVSTVCDLQWVHYTTPQVAEAHAGDFSQWHLWFISLLLLFFLSFAAWFRLFHHHPQPKTDIKAAKPWNVLFTLSIAALFCIVGMTLVQFVSPDWGWGKIGGLILIQPTRLPIYAAFFVMGLYAFSRNWFKTHLSLFTPWIWAILSVIFSILVLGVLMTIGDQQAPIPLGQALFHSTARSMGALAFLCFFLSVGQRWGQRRTTIWRHLHPVSYDIYLIHLPIAVIFQLLIVNLSMAASVKFILVSTATIAASWSIGKFIVKPFPVVTTGLSMTIFGIICIIL